MPATQPFLVYRDRIGVPSEIGFLRRQYVGFSKLHPVWTGRTLLPGAAEVGDQFLRLGGDGPLGPIRRLLFRHLERAPAINLRGIAPVLHAQFARGGALALPLAGALGLRMVVTLHGGDISKQKNWHRSVLARRWPALLRETAHFICVSAAVAEVAAFRGVPSRQLVVLPIGVEIPDARPVSHPTAYLFVGRFVEKKGIAVLTEAMRRLRAAGDQTPLVCVGDGPLRPLLEGLARDIPGITLTAWQSPEAVRERMAQAVCLVVPSVVGRDGDAEGLPSVVPEAMAAGCPVIGSDQGGIAEAIRHDVTGLLVAAGNAGSLAEAMGRISAEPSLRDRLAAAGFAEAARTLNAYRQSAELETLLLSV
jgi:colanic acid/amylovoran biosynthesis glycosyltransferase